MIQLDPLAKAIQENSQIVTDYYHQIGTINGSVQLRMNGLDNLPAANFRNFRSAVQQLSTTATTLGRKIQGSDKLTPNQKNSFQKILKCLLTNLQMLNQELSKVDQSIPRTEPHPQPTPLLPLPESEKSSRLVASVQKTFDQILGQAKAQLTESTKVLATKVNEFIESLEKTEMLSSTLHYFTKISLDLTSRERDLFHLFHEEILTEIAKSKNVVKHFIPKKSGVCLDFYEESVDASSLFEQRDFSALSIYVESLKPSSDYTPLLGDIAHELEKDQLRELNRGILNGEEFISFVDKTESLNATSLEFKKQPPKKPFWPF